MTDLAETIPCSTIHTPLTAQLSPTRGDSAQTLVVQEFNAAALGGALKFVHEIRIPGGVAVNAILPEGSIIERCVTSTRDVRVLARHELGLIMIDSYANTAFVTVAASNEGRASMLAAQIRDLVPDDRAEGTIPIRTWHARRSGDSVTSDRRVPMPAWSSIRRNYPASVRTQLEAVIAVTQPETSGKLILWHGAPGTGKTTALRALLREWEPWCAAQYISDPEKFFDDPGYITDVLTRPTQTTNGPTFTAASDSAERWRLIIAEDANEYLRVGPRGETRPGLGRLLNLADGVLGQGFKTLVLLTTNEHIERIHPAVTRPGRCLARVEFSLFSPSEAREWLPLDTAAPARSQSSLAEMYEATGMVTQIGESSSSALPIGQYL